MRSYTILMIVGVLFSASLSEAGVVVADIAADYTNAPGYVAGTTAPSAPPTGWQYLYSDAATGGTEVNLTAQTAIGNVGNTGFGGPASFSMPGVLGGRAGGAQYEIFTSGFDDNAGVVGADLNMHPGDSAATKFVIARYTISATDISIGNAANIAGSFRRLAINSNGISAGVYHNSTSLWSTNSATTGDVAMTIPEGSFSLSKLEVVEGDTISFVVDSNGNFGGDETALTGTITMIPPKATSIMLQ